jgi:hypothetical protein
MAQRQQGHQKLARLVADLLPQSATLTPQDRMLLGRGVVAAADELLLASLDNESNVSREDVVELVMVSSTLWLTVLVTERIARQEVRRNRCVLP